MRLMMRWSPMSSVFSIEPEGITRAWPMAPLMSRKTRPTQNHAMTSRWIFVPIGILVSVFFVLSALMLSAFTIHHHRPLCGRGFPIYCNRRTGLFSVGSRLADFQLDKIRRVNTRIARRAKPAFGVRDGFFERRKGQVAKRICAEEFADFFGRVRGSD